MLPVNDCCDLLSTTTTEREHTGGRTDTIKNRKETSGVEGGRGICYQWKEKGQCLQGDRCSFRHETHDRAQKPEHTAATLSEPSFSRGRSVSKKKVSKAKVAMVPFSDNRADIT